MAHRLFILGLFLSIAMAASCVAAVVWVARSEDPIRDPVLAIGNKEVVVFRQGWDFRIALLKHLPEYGIGSRSPTETELAARDAKWGRPNHWLKLPEGHVSLWWAAALSSIAPAFWMFRQRSHPGRGFPVLIVRQGTKP
ncbi:MAG: hypothetical protein ABSH20_00855 [Tepidisphaeraceae bacterium]